jgi:hypothetical protein
MNSDCQVSSCWNPEIYVCNSGPMAVSNFQVIFYFIAHFSRCKYSSILFLWLLLRRGAFLALESLDYVQFFFTFLVGLRSFHDHLRVLRCVWVTGYFSFTTVIILVFYTIAFHWSYDSLTTRWEGGDVSFVIVKDISLKRKLIFSESFLSMS